MPTGGPGSFSLQTLGEPVLSLFAEQPPVVRNEQLNIVILIVSVHKIELGFILKKTCQVSADKT